MTPFLSRSVGAAATVCVLGVIASACGGSKAPAPTTQPSQTTTTTLQTIPPAPSTTTTAPVPTTAAPVIPPAPQPTAEAAANALVGYWASGNRTTALRVATPQAVSTLFAVKYPSGLAINRGCTSAFPPIICTFGAPGGGPINAPIYQLYESQAPGGWYVGSVQIQ
ncbi:MAG TPA: hypothetical protein VMU64_08340 [Acidimicrobiales bacterium]|nr:hypothetical protein [Acidimicrobiales bacterium]